MRLLELDNKNYENYNLNTNLNFLSQFHPRQHSKAFIFLTFSHHFIEMHLLEGPVEGHSMIDYDEEVIMKRKTKKKSPAPGGY